jgi:hypothetical protein
LRKSIAELFLLLLLLLPCSAFEGPALKEFVRNLRYEPVAPVSGGKLGTVETIEAWDGQDAAVQVEDEFSLDDIMGDDDKEL